MSNTKLQATVCQVIKPPQMVTWKYTEDGEFICCLSADRCRTRDRRGNFTALPVDCPAPWDEDDRVELDSGLPLSAVHKG
ncbi:MAG: hypothetical protein AB1489_06515 [Acidobacteriota bacterium]